MSLLVIQPKPLRKLIQQTFQQYATLKEDDCIIKFFETLKDFINYDEEVFPCELVVSSPLNPMVVMVLNIRSSKSKSALVHINITNIFPRSLANSKVGVLQWSWSLVGGGFANAHTRIQR